MKKKTRAAVQAALFTILWMLSFQGQARDQGPDRLSSGDVAAGSSEIEPLIERFSADKRSLDRYYGVAFSPSRFSRMETFYRK